MASDIEKYKEARDFKELKETDGFKRLREFMEKSITGTKEVAVTSGWESLSDEHDALVSARTLFSVLHKVDVAASRYEKLKEALKEQGIPAE